MTAPQRGQSDLARNWNGSIAMKMTAVTIWAILVLAFIITIPFVSTFEDISEKEYSWQKLQFVKLIEELQQSNADTELIRQKTHEFMLNSDIQFIQLTLNNQNLSFGKSSSSSHKSQSLSHNQDIHTIIEFEFPSLERAAKLTRVKYGSAIVGFSVLFSIFLFWLNKKIIHQPFEEIITLTQRISKGEYQLRLKSNRRDEFGQVSKFMDQMLDTLETKQKQLKDTNIELLDEIRHREEALAASQQKSAFLANMSHEIRTPLSSIIGYSERIRFNKVKNEEDRNQMLDIVLQNGNHLLHLVNDILDLSKVEANKLKIEKQPFSIIKIAEHVRRLLSEKALAKGIQLNINYILPIPEKIITDPTRIKQIILNLASNAIRFTDDGKVDINISYEISADMLTIEINDTGIGMTREQLNNLFKPFSQADDSISRRFGGTGLGLTISKRLAQLMDGDISVDSIKGLGSKFTCHVKAGFDSEHNHLIETLTPRDLEAPEYNRPLNDIMLSGYILLVEDTMEIQQLVKAYLEDYGIRIDTADNGRIGIEMAMENDYDLILMDIQMPVLSGREAIKELRLMGYTKPVLALTADALTEHEQEFKKIGFSDTLTKPIMINNLVETIQRYLDTEHQTKATTAATSSPESDSTELSILDLKEKYLKQLPVYIDELRRSLTNNDLQQAQSLLHQLKGISGSLGYQEITDIAAETSELLHSDHMEQVMSNINLIESYYQR